MRPATSEALLSPREDHYKLGQTVAGGGKARRGAPVTVRHTLCISVMHLHMRLHTHAHTQARSAMLVRIFIDIMVSIPLTLNLTIT